MERRIRSFVDRRGADDAAGLPEALQRDRASLDGFLDRVTINVSELYRNPEQCDVLRTKVLPELHGRRPAKSGAPAAPTAPRPTRSPAWSPRRLPGERVEIAGTDIDRRIVERARGAASSPRTRAPCRRAALRPLLQARRRRLARRARALPQAPALRDRGPAARALPGGARPRALPQRRHLLQRRRPQRTCTPASPVRCGPAATRGRRHRARRRPARARACRAAIPSSTERR